MYGLVASSTFLTRTPGGNFTARLARRFLPSQFLRVLVLIFLTHGSSAGSAWAHVQKQLAASAGRVSSFAISDFDGDLRPDLVNVQIGQIKGVFTDYWIEFHLTTSARPSIRLVARSGGLLIEARDVNGDDAVDLVLATAWFTQPVAILVNDGYGGFSQVQLTAFPETFTDSTAKWVSDSAQSNEGAGTPPRWRFGFCLDGKGVSSPSPPVDSVSVSNLSFLVGSSLILRVERAPPSS